jgi:hypothetical protein
MQAGRFGLLSAVAKVLKRISLTCQRAVTEQINMLGSWRVLLLLSVMPPSQSMNVVRDFTNALHFHSTVRNTPHGARPPSLVAFYDSNSLEKLFGREALNFPSDLAKTIDRTDLLIGAYDVGRQEVSTTFSWVDDVMDLAKRFGIEANNLPALALIPNEYAFPDNNTATPKLWTESPGGLSWRQWLDEELDLRLHSASEWGAHMLLQRDNCETNEWLRCLKFPEQLPRYTKAGYLKMKMPAEIQDRLLNYYNTHREKIRNVEDWELDACHTNHHEVDMTMVSLDHDMVERDEIGVLQWSASASTVQTK